MKIIEFGGDNPCLTVKGKDKALYECIVECLEDRTGLHVMQGRVIVLFDEKDGKKKAGKKK